MGTTESAMNSFTFIVPLSNNEGTPFMIADFNELDVMLLDQFGGFSFSTGIHGAWRNESGVVYRDQSRQYDVAIEWRDIASLVPLIDWVRTRFEQEAIFRDTQWDPAHRGTTKELRQSVVP